MYKIVKCKWPSTNQFFQADGARDVSVVVVSWSVCVKSDFLRWHDYSVQGGWVLSNKPKYFLESYFQLLLTVLTLPDPLLPIIL